MAPTQYRIVTNGSLFRIQSREAKGEWTTYETYHSVPEGFGYASPWETRFYLRALKRYSKLAQQEVVRSRGEQWEAI